MAGAPNADLQALLDDFAKQVGGTSSAYYQDVCNAIVNSPRIAESDERRGDRGGSERRRSPGRVLSERECREHGEIGFDSFFRLMDLPSSLMTTIANNH
jgi:hypothetical protein